jgi:hypothetical protein
MAMENLNSPATKGDLQELAAQLRAESQELGAQLRSESQHIVDDLREGLRDIQTEMLKAFYSVTQSNQERFRAVEDTESALKKRLAVLEDRMIEVERRLNMPPAA